MSDAEALLQRGLDLLERGELSESDAVLAAASDADGGDELRARLAGARGGLRRAQGRYPEADALLRTALALAESTWGPRSPELVTLLNELAVLGKYTGNFTEAERLYRRALAILEDDLGPDHPDLASLHHNLGGLAHARGDHVAAEAPARRAVTLRERAAGPDDPVVAADRAALAAILDALGRRDEARALLTDALRVFERAGEQHDVAVTLNNLAAIAYQDGRVDDAVPLSPRALAVKRAVLPPGHPELAPTLHNLALAVSEQDPTRAELLWREAVDILSGRVEDTHPTLLLCREHLRAAPRS